jgi:hypothetical protein
MRIEKLTRREVWLAVFLLVSLLSLSKSRANFNLTPSIQTPHDDKPPTHNSSYVEHEREPKLLHDRIRWGANDVPQTKIVAHVPGESCLVFSSNAILN